MNNEYLDNTEEDQDTDRKEDGMSLIEAVLTCKPFTHVDAIGGWIYFRNTLIHRDNIEDLFNKDFLEKLVLGHTGEGISSWQVNAIKELSPEHFELI